MVSNLQSSAKGGISYKLEHTTAGRPYIDLKTSSAMPIYLTEYYSTDVEAAHATVSIPSIYLNIISIPQPYTIEDAESWISLQLTGRSNLPLQALRAGDPETGTFVGTVSLMPTDGDALRAMREKVNMPQKESKEGQCELGYYLHPEWRGKGIMRNAVRALIWWGREQGVESVLVRALEENLESRAVIESLVEFVRVEEGDEWVDWSESKGGGRKKMFMWRWAES